jgi:glycosyltransferase involved in cell wall biosynthesis
VTRRRIAIVTPWYGPEASGGAETLAREFAVHLSQADDVTILTTTGRSFLADWGSNYFKPGRTKERGYEVLRFRVGRRNNDEFHRINGELMKASRADWDELVLHRARLEPFIDDSINSPGLEDYLRGSEAAKYDAVVFVPYLYGVVVRGIEAYPGPAHLLPCLHDEAYARLPRLEDLFHRAASLLFNSEGEAELALRIYGPGILHKCHVIGAGISLPAGDAPSVPMSEPYFLFLGRRDATKGLDFLIEAFKLYRQSSRSGYSLVLAGPGNNPYDDPEQGIRDLGFVDEGTKRALLRQARALVQPSVNESYSRVIMEAWREGLPVVARAGCLATATAVDRSGGGFVAEGLDSWCETFSRIELANSEELKDLGRRGLAYAALHSNWDNVVEQFRFATALSGPAIVRPRGKRIDQVVETMAYGDAISDYARSLRSHLRALGYESDIYARIILPRVAAEARVISPEALAAAQGLIYHHSIDFNDLETILSAPTSKALIYHNITPAHFFRDYDAAFAGHLERGRAQLSLLADTFKLCAADSRFNADELRDFGFEEVTVIPVPINFARFDITPAPISQMSDGPQWLFVGRISPSKGLRQLLEAFEVFACLEPAARLILVGAYHPADRYYQELMKLVIERHLEANVVFAGIVDEATLTAHYRSADVYVCLSEHEGFCVPLVEAMYFDVPIVAAAKTAIVETLGDSGVLIDGMDALETAALVREVLSDGGLRARVIDSQRRRRTAFLPENVFRDVDAFVARIA